MASVAPNIPEHQREPLTPQEFPSVFVSADYAQFHDIPRVPFAELKPQRYYLEYNRYRNRFAIIYVCNIHRREPRRHLWYYRLWEQNLEDWEWVELPHELLSDGQDEFPWFDEHLEYFDLENGFDLGAERVQLDHKRVSQLSCGPMPPNMVRPPGRIMNRFLRMIGRGGRGARRKTYRKPKGRHRRRRTTRRHKL